MHAKNGIENMVNNCALAILCAIGWAVLLPVAWLVAHWKAALFVCVGGLYGVLVWWMLG